MNNNAVILVVGGVASGLASAGLTFASPFTIMFHPGVVFAIFVAVPWGRMSSGSAGIAKATGAMCVVGYFVAYWLSIVSDMWAAPLAAGLGTSLMLVPAMCLDPGPSRKACLGVIATGTLAAVLFPLAPLMSDAWPLLLLGIAFWQGAVAVALAAALPTPLNEVPSPEASDW